MSDEAALARAAGTAFVQLPWALLRQGAGVVQPAERAWPRLVFPRAGVSSVALQRAAWWDQRAFAKLQPSLQTCKKYNLGGRILPCWLCVAGAQGGLLGSTNPWLVKQLWGVCAQLWGGSLQQAESRAAPRLLCFMQLPTAATIPLCEA